jgi:D-3-phosphoglycerate dehydrogenase
MKVVITDWGFQSLDIEQELFTRAGVTLEAHQCRSEDETARVVGDADVVLTQWAPVKRKAIDTMRCCRGIVRYGIGLDNIDLAYARERGIPVRNVPDYCLAEVADHTMALLLALQRQLCSVHGLVRSGTWKITPPVSLPPLRDSILGLVGFGRIARLVSRRAAAFGMTVLASDPLVSPAVITEGGASPATLDVVFGTSDIVSLHCPLTEETHHLAGRNTLVHMKPLAILVNTSRGGLVDTGALVDALTHQRLAGAALDVVEEEPLEANHPLLSFQNVIVTSHTAWYSNKSVGELQRKAAQAALDLLGLRG